jgi:hypothetical protein
MHIKKFIKLIMKTMNNIFIGKKVHCNCDDKKLYTQRVKRIDA